MLKFIRHLENYGALERADLEILKTVVGRVRLVAADQDIAREGDVPTECSIVLDGLVSRYKLLPTGKRQILSFHIPGDMVDLQAFLLGLDHNIASLTPTRVGYISHAVLNDIITRHPRIGRALWRTALADSAIFRERLASLGRRSATQRVAHLLCELYCRYSAVGLAQGYSFELSATQSELGDALGLSYVHVNRTLQALRNEGLITWRGTSFVIEDWQELKLRGLFDDGYLHIGDVRGEPTKER